MRLAIPAAGLSKRPTTLVEVNDADMAKRVLSLMEKLEVMDDVQKVHSNFDIHYSLLNLES